MICGPGIGKEKVDVYSWWLTKEITSVTGGKLCHAEIEEVFLKMLFVASLWRVFWKRKKMLCVLKVLSIHGLMWHIQNTTSCVFLLNFRLARSVCLCQNRAWSCFCPKLPSVIYIYSVKYQHYSFGYGYCSLIHYQHLLPTPSSPCGRVSNTTAGAADRKACLACGSPSS